MSRIEKNQPVVEEMARMKGDLMDAARQKPKRRGVGACAVALLVLVLGLAAWAAWTVAAMGVAVVPVFSGMAYDAPTPVRAVSPGVPLADSVTRQILESSSKTDMTLVISEATLTTLVRDTLSQSGQDAFDDGAAQAAISESGVELYLPLRDNAQANALVTELGLFVEEGRLAATTERATLGSWNVPGWLREGVLDPALAAAVTNLNDAFAGRAELVSVEAQDGSLVLRVRPLSPA